MDARIVNIGALGALVTVGDLEEPVVESDRVMLRHPVLDKDTLSDETALTAGSVVRVELDFTAGGVSRNLAVYFDGGPPPDGYVERP